jgi:sulfonate transport system substrate-binding protein
MNADHPSRPARRRTLGLLAAGVMAAVAAGLHAPAFAQPAQEVRIGYQKYGTLTLLKGRGTLEQRLAASNITVKWTEFPAGPCCWKA